MDRIRVKWVKDIQQEPSHRIHTEDKVCCDPKKR